MSNVLSFDLLQQGLSKIADLGLIEDEVEIYDTRICIRTLRASEHKMVNAYVASYMNKYEDEDASFPLDATMDFFTVRKIEPLTYAIQEFGDMNLRGIEFIETGDVDKNGNPVKIEKNVFLRRMLSDMDLAVVDALHRKYVDILSDSEERAVEKIQFRNPEEELERIESRRRELLEELGRLDEIEGTENESAEDENNPSGLEGEKIAEELRNAAFGNVDETEAERLLREREDGARQETQDEAPSKPVQEEKPDEIEVGNEKFIRLDDPDTPYSEEEQMYLEEQERLFQEQNGGPVEDEDPRAEDAQARLRKRRQPLNQVAPQVQEGELPSKQNLHRAPVVRKSQVDMSDIPLADGYEDHEPERLNRAGGDQKGSDGGQVNPNPEGGVNPHFKGNK